jgi:hypothetical protein
MGIRYRWVRRGGFRNALLEGTRDSEEIETGDWRSVFRKLEA